MDVIHTGQALPLQDKNIILTGFMGVGKTTIGQLIARKLNREFIDADEEIVRRQNMPVTEIFQIFGEAKFREMEKDCIVDLCRNTRSKVVSLGGGAFMQDEIRNVCMSTSLVVHLELSWEAWKTRYPQIMHNRPLLQQKSLLEIEKLFLSRKEAYAIHHLKINTDDVSPEEAAEQIASHFQPSK